MVATFNILVPYSPFENLSRWSLEGLGGGGGGGEQGGSKFPAPIPFIPRLSHPFLISFHLLCYFG